MNRIDIKAFGAVGDGIADDFAAVQRALDCGGLITVPKGIYRITKTLKIGSNTTLYCDNGAHFLHCGSLEKHRGDFLLSNSDTVNGNDGITVIGGKWDGNFDGVNNTKNPDLFDKNACSGAVLNFVNVKGLRLEELEVANSVVYFVRMAKLDGFIIRNIGFSAERLSFNQDGLHFGGECRNGLVDNIRALTNGETNDDMIALNADDSMDRLENLDLCRGDIENIIFRNIYAENCYTAVRLLSVTSAIRNIFFENIDTGCRMYAINMDGARYCRTPLTNEDDFPHGSGLIENVHFKNFRIRLTGSPNTLPLIFCETVMKNFVLENAEFVFDVSQKHPPLLHVKNVPGIEAAIKNNDSFVSFRSVGKSETLDFSDNMTYLGLDVK